MGNLTGSEIKKKKTESVVAEAKCSNRRIMQESLAVHLILISFYFFPGWALLNRTRLCVVSHARPPETEEPALSSHTNTANSVC